MKAPTLWCSGIRQRTNGSRLIKHRQYQAVVYSAVQYSRGRWKWIFTYGANVWRINENDAMRDAELHATQMGIGYMPAVRGGDSVKESLLVPDTLAGIIPADNNGKG